MPKLCLASLSLATLIMLSACGGKSEAELITAAKEYLSLQNYSAATIQLKNALQKNAESAEARLLLGKALLGQGDAAGAEIELRQARRLKVADELVMPELARALLAQGENRKLIDEFGLLAFGERKAMADFKTSIASAHAALGARERAQAAVDDALRLMPGYGAAMILQARLKAGIGDFDAALKLMEDLTAREPGNAQAFMLRGDLLMAKDDSAGARAAFEKALKLRADLARAHSALITMHLAAKDVNAAGKQLEAMRKALPRHPDTLVFEAQMLMVKGQFKEAQTLLQKGLRGMPDHPRMLLLAGAVELQLGASAPAETLLMRAVQAMPNDVGARRLLARANMQSNQPDKAINALRPILESGHADAESLTLAGQAYLAIGDLKSAETYFSKAVQSQPDSAKARTALAMSQIAQGKADTGFSDLRNIAASDTGIAADMALISALVRRRELDKALTAIDAMERKQGDKSIPANLRGQLMLLRKDNAGARKSFEAAVAARPDFFPAIASLAALDFLEGKPDAAKARFEAVLKADPKSSRALIALAELKGRTGGSPTDVAELLKSAVKANPSDVLARRALIDHYMNHDGAQDSLLAAQAAVAALPDSPELQERLGRAQLASGDANQALATFNKLISVQPRSVSALLGLADTQLASNDMDGAARSVKRAVELAPDALQTQRAAIMLALRQKRYDDALKTARKVQQKFPGQALGFMLEGEIEQSQQHYEQAIAAFRTALGKSSPAQAPAQYHFALLKANKTAEASKFIETWTKEQPKDALFLLYLADQALTHQDYADAEKRLQQLLGVRPNYPIALNNLAWALFKQGKLAPALEAAEKAVKAAPGQPALMDTLASVLAASKQVARALEIQKQVVAMVPTSTSYRLNLAKLHAQAGDKSYAIVELKNLVKQGKKDYPEKAEVTRMLADLQ